MEINLLLGGLLGLACLAVAGLSVVLWRRSSSSSQSAETLQRLENLEHGVYEALRDLRGEQNVLARAARMENQAASDRLSEQIDKRVERLADLTDKNLERIRTTVDDRLNESLEQKFGQVSRRLEALHHSLGEMQGLAGGVNDLKKILTNVKTRGIWGEMQLGNLLQDILPKDHLAENVEVVPHSNCRVEFAVRLPGAEEHNEILLPIDSKFPQADYQRLQAAREAGDAAAAAQALKQLDKRFRAEAKDISEKYVCPPYSTDFGIMYLPSEGLYIEALNQPGLVDRLQREYRVCVAGPSTLAALLNSLHMGFRTLAVQQRTDEVWQLLSSIRQDTDELVAALDKTSKKLDEAQSNISLASQRVLTLSRRLQAVDTWKYEE